MDADELEARNAALRHRRATDPEWNAEQNRKKREYRARLSRGEAKVHHRHEPQEEATAARDMTDFWVTQWRLLNSEDEAVIKKAKRNVLNHMSQIVNRNAKARDEIHGVGSENGLADDVADEFTDGTE